MGTGASNQVRSEKAEKISLNSQPLDLQTENDDRPLSSKIISKNKRRQENQESMEQNNRSSSNSTHKNSKKSNGTTTKDIIPKKIDNPTSANSIFTPVQSASISSLDSKQSNNETSLDKLSRAELMKKLKEIEAQLVNSESQRLDAMDQIQILEEKMKNQQLQNSNHIDSDMNETIHVKDQLIIKLEKDFKNSEAEAKTTRLKLKRRIKGLTSKLQEIRQEYSINQMELKAELTQLREQLKDKSSSANSSKVKTDLPEPSGNHSHLVVELSNQMSEQSEKIQVLENQLMERDAHIQSLQSVSSNVSCSGDRLRSSQGSRKTQSSVTARELSKRSPLPLIGTTTSALRPSCSRQSSALSDSDSDWELDKVRLQSHSAPARSRKKNSTASRPVAKEGGSNKDDNSLLKYLSSDPSQDAKTIECSSHPHKKSALRKHLEKKKNDNQVNSLNGPSLAISPSGQNPPNESFSLERTPHYNDKTSSLPGFSNITIVQAVNN